MTRQMPTVTIALCVAATALFSGCQRPMGSASGPYSPAGSLPPSGGQPLVPFGSIHGATRVPPPPTGSSQVSNGYDGQPAAMFSANQSVGVGGDAANRFAQAGPLQSSASGSRTAMGGMPVIDLTAGMMNAPSPVIYDSVAQAGGGSGIDSGVMSSGAIGSGVAMADWQTTGANISVPPADFASRLRPLDSAQAAAIVPFPAAQDYVPSDGPVVAMTQYRHEGSASPAWQGVQPAVAHSPVPSGNAFEQRAVPAAYESQSPARSLPSTDPVQPPASKSAASDTLLWRNPAVAR